MTTYIKTTVNKGEPDEQIYQTFFDISYKNTFYKHFTKIPSDFKTLITEWTSVYLPKLIMGETETNINMSLLDHEYQVLLDMLEDEWI